MSENILGSKYPIIQTAMGWVATPELVAASSKAGAFGFLALATATKDEAINMIKKTSALTDMPFGINLHMFQPGAEEIIDAAIKMNVRAVSYSRSPAQKFIKKQVNMHSSYSFKNCCLKTYFIYRCFSEYQQIEKKIIIININTNKPVSASI